MALGALGAPGSSVVAVGHRQEDLEMARDRVGNDLKNLVKLARDLTRPMGPPKWW